MPALQGYQSSNQQAGQATSISAPATQEAARSLSSLSQNLEQFSKSALNRFAGEKKVEAADNALADFQKYKQNIAKIKETALSPMDRDLKLNKLREDRFVQSGTIYGAAYENAYSAAYTNEMSIDVMEKSAFSEILAKGNADSFAEMMGNYGSEMVKNAPSAQLAQVTKLAFEKAGVAGFKKLSLATSSDNYARNKKLSEDTVEALSGLYAQSYQQGEVNEANSLELLAQANAAIDSAEKQGYMTAPIAASRKLSILKNGQTQRIKADYQKSIKYFGEHQFMEDLMKDESLLNMYTPDEIGKIISDLKTDMTVRAKVEEAEDLEYKAIFERNKEKAKKNLALLSIHGSLSIKDIDKSFSMGYLNKTEADNWYTTIGEGGKKAPDMGAELIYRASIGAYSDDRIIKDNRLNNSQKIGLLEFKEKEASDPASKWTSTIEGKNSIERIKNNWKELMVTLPGMPVSKKKIEDFNSVYNEFINEMQKLPEGQRQSRAIPMADAILAAYREKEFERTSKRAIAMGTSTKDKQVKKEEIIEQDVQSYRDSLTEAHRGYYDRGVAQFRTSFGNTGLINFGGSNKDIEW